MESLKLCQKELHDRGQANQVTFDPGKESFHILAISEAKGPDFKLLGVTFDVSLPISNAINELVQEAKLKLKMLIKTRRFYTDGELVILYKAHLLSYLEYRTAAVYHAKREKLVRLDGVQSKFLEEAGINDKIALMVFNLAPLAARRDMAMLGIIHRTVLGKGPRQFRDYFKRSETGGRLDPRETLGGELAKRSALGLVAIYN
jgi:hypothetical protein